jgi:hypothetical protein
MNKQEMILKKEREAKHSIVYKTKEDVAIIAVYVMRKHLGKPIPQTIKVTVEEV